MKIPQINAEQVSALTEMAKGVGAISVLEPDMKEDSYEKYNTLTAELCDLNHLVILGLLKDITTDHKEQLTQMYAIAKRHFRIFELTAMGKTMFDGQDRAIQ